MISDLLGTFGRRRRRRCGVASLRLDVVAVLRVDATNADLEDVGSDVAVPNAPALPGRESFVPEVPCFFFGER